MIYITILIVLFFFGIAVWLVGHAQIETLETKAFWQILSDAGVFLSASTIIHLVYFYFVKKDEKKETQELKNQFFSETKKAIECVIHGIHKWGFVRFHDKMSFSDLFNQLQEGDDLYWLDTYFPHILTSAEAIKDAITRKANIKMLIMDPGSGAVRWRAQEIKNMYTEKQFREGLDAFIEFIDSQKKQYPSSIDYRKYRDLPGIPFYIIKKSDHTIKAYSSFYMSKPSADIVHIEWSSGTENGGLASIFIDHFLKKWDRWAKPDLPMINGEWKYEMSAEDIQDWSGNGNCHISQKGRTLNFTGSRITMNGQKISPVRWWSNWSEICNTDDIVRFDYVIESKINEEVYPSFCKLKITEKSETAENVIANKMEGNYFLLKNNSTEDVASQSRYGSIVFTRVK